MTELGHVVYYVRDLETSLGFYTEAVGLRVVGRLFNGRAALLTGGRTHHELLVIEVGEAQGPSQGKQIGLFHVGWKIGESLEELKQARDRIAGLGYRIAAMSDHTVTRSLYLRDPDGNEVELYVDNPEFDWQQDPSWIEVPVKTLIL